MVVEGPLQVWSGGAKNTGEAGIHQVVGVKGLDITGSRLQPRLQNSNNPFRSGMTARQPRVNKQSRRSARCKYTALCLLQALHSSTI